MKIKKSVLWLLGGVGVLVLTNPSRSAFTSYLHESSSQGLGRDVNFFVASVYSDGENKYVGVVGNFVEVPLRAELTPSAVHAGYTDMEDTSAIDTSITNHMYKEKPWEKAQRMERELGRDLKPWEIAKIEAESRN